MPKLPSDITGVYGDSKMSFKAPACVLSTWDSRIEILLTCVVATVPVLDIWILPVALVYKSQDFRKNLRTCVGIEPTPSHLRCTALPVELSSPWIFSYMKSLSIVKPSSSNLGKF